MSKQNIPEDEIHQLHHQKFAWSRTKDSKIDIIEITMGVTELEIQVANLANPGKRENVKCLVDSSAVYSVIPEIVLKRLGIKSHSKEKFILTDGSEIERDGGDALFLLDGKRGASPVVFGKRGDGVLLGVVTLESLGFILDPIRRRLRSLPMLLV